MKRTLCVLLSLMLAVTGFAGLAVPASAEGTGSSAIKTITDGELVAYNYASLTDAEKAVLTSGQVIGDSYTYSVPGSGVDLVSIDTDAKTITAANYADTVGGLTWVPTTGRVVWSDGSEEVTFNSGTASYNYEGGPFTAEVAYTATIDVRTNLQKALLNGPVYLAKGLDALAAFSGQIDVYDTVAVYFNVYNTLLPYISDENAKKAITDLDIEIDTYGSVAILDFALEYEDAGDKVAYLFDKGPAFKDAAMSFFGKVQTIYDDPEVITAINNHLSGTQMNNAQRLNGYLGQFLADTMVAADGGWEIFETANHTFKVDADTELLGTLAAAISNRSLHDDAIVSDLAVPTEVIEIVVEQTAPSSLSTDISVLTNGVNTANAKTIWYGGSAWRVIGYNGEGVASETGTATLLASGNMGHAYFNDGSNGNTNKYDGSTLKSKIDDIAALFSAVERGAISKRTLIKGGYDGANTDCIAGDADLADQLLWPLSIKEAYALNDTLRIADPEHPTWGSSYWWLRSPGIMEDRDCVAFIVGVGNVNEDGRSPSFEETGVRPAFRINLQSVLFTSAAEDGKQGDGTLSPFGDYTGSEWKLTVLDADRSGFTASCASTNGDVRTVKYSGAKTGDNEYISAIIVDGDGAVTYYGRLCKAKAGSNKTAVVDVSGKMNEGDKLYVFNEQYNGDKKTDFSSALVDVTPNLGSGMTVNIEDLKQGLNTLDAKTVWYGGSTWRVIGFAGAGAASTADTMTLFANGSMGTTMFDQDGNTQKRYSGSDLEKQTKQIYNNAFSGPEQLAVKDTTLGSGTYDGANTDGVEGSSVGYARLWPLSTREANAVNADLRKDSGDWWLRSPGDGSNNVAFVTKQGNVDHSGRSFRSELGVRPAFYVDLDRVIFASAAVGGKQGDGALTPIDGYPGNEWKLTVWEGNHRWFSVTETEASGIAGETFTLHYQYAETGENEYISAIVTDLDGNALYYGRIMQPTDENGTLEITIPADLEKGAFSLYVFNEQVNGDKHTDYASDLIEVVKADAVKAADLQTGDTFEMGMYPQTQVTDDATITALNAIDCTMTNYGYMQNSKADNHTFDAVDMTYADIAYNGQAYRKVTINEYRPYFTVLPSSSSNTYQADNGYVTGNTYYFKWEPIVWQVLARESDGVYVMSQSLLDSPSYHNYLEFSTWETSSLRTWLNEGFYNGAFSEGERSKLISCTLSNVCDNPLSIDDGGNDTTDKLWVLSFSDSIDSAYGFQDRYYSDPAKEAAGTDYAKSQGLSADPSNGCSIWWLRSPGEGVPCGSGINENGYGPCNPRRDSTEIGVRPAFKLNLDATVGTSDPKTLIQDPNLTMENQEAVYGETITLTATLAQNAAGTVDFTVTKDAFTATYSANIENGAATVSLPVLDAGTYSVTAEYAGHGNFDAGTASATLTVNQKAVSVRVTGLDGPYKQYNGQEQSHTDTVVWIYDRDESGLDEAKLRYTGNTTVKGTNAGRYETALSADYCVCDDSNFDVTFTAQGTICFTIGQSVLDITADSKETNHGEDLAALTYTIKSNHNYYYNEAELEISISTDADKNKPGSYEITVTVQDNPNYAIRVFGGTYTVGNSPHTWGGVTYTWTGTASVKAERKCVYCDEVETETKATTSQQTKAPTCTEKGETTYTATFSNTAFETQTKTVDDIPALDHAYDAVVTEPTCTEDGYTTHTCSRCGDTYTDSETEKLGHAWGEWEIVRTATPNEKGEKKRVCSRCSAVETAEIDELMITSSVDGQTGSNLVVTVPYAQRGAIATTLTAEEPVTYTSSNPKLLTVDENGNVQFVRLCIFCKSATITTVSADGSKVATCKVNIEIKWWQYIVWFFLGSLWF